MAIDFKMGMRRCKEKHLIQHMMKKCPINTIYLNVSFVKVGTGSTACKCSINICWMLDK